MFHYIGASKTPMHDWFENLLDRMTEAILLVLKAEAKENHELVTPKDPN